MNLQQKFIRLLATIPVLYFLLIFFVGVAGIISFGEVPQYGLHPEPSDLGVAWITGIALLILMAGYLITPILLFLIADEVFNKRKFNPKVKIHLALACLSLVCWIILKYFFPSFFAWIMD
jgi:hypothetical protein